ncbi:hypothetical protein M8818_004419 [Zalaria obscura]|uniref:Uncharacterized protein n=1 Tax=Zalaria obscura TaxID=2024903 RepID=A0ACC3SBH3_9PEZI
MSDADTKSLQRPPTPHDFHLLKSLRFFDNSNAPAPPSNSRDLPVHRPNSVHQQQVDSPSAAAASLSSPPAAAQSPPSPALPTTEDLSQSPEEVKRDSAISPSEHTSSPPPTAADSHSHSRPDLRHSASVPTIVVQDDTSPTGKRRKSPLSVFRSRQHDPLRRQGSSGYHRRIRSFRGINMEIPTGSLEDLSSPGKLQFSTRGSVVLSKAEVAAANGNGKVEEPQQKSWDKPKKGLVAGRRKPSIQMLQAAVQGGRVLSAEEISFSMRVRSMYEHGDEEAGNRVVSPGAPPTPRATAPGPEEREGATPDAEDRPLNIQKTRPGLENGTATSPTTTLPRSVTTTSLREPHELAGGIEDWEDVQGGAVDRYGFIDPTLPANRQRAGSASQKAGSLYSYKSSTSSTFVSRPFRSRDRRLMDDASDMLTLPPGLAQIAEQDDAGRTATAAKQREWRREQKWQKMARLTNRASNGAGMSFDFDTTDPKLISRTWKGIPDRWRATAWHAFLSASAKKREGDTGASVSDATLVQLFHAYQAQSCADDVQIDVDVPRTINLHIMFRRRYRGGQRLLFRVLHAVALHFPDVGYVQGMAALAATLLCYYDEEAAFVMMVRLWQLRGLEQLFKAGFEGLMAALKEFEDDWLAGSDVARKLNELGIASTAYGTRWYLTLFNMSIPFPAQLRVWDVFMLLGDRNTTSSRETGVGSFDGADLDVLHAAGAALVDATREIVMDSDFENVMKVLTSWIPVRDEDLLMRVARAEWRMKQKRDRSGSRSIVCVVESDYNYSWGRPLNLMCQQIESGVSLL